MAVSIIRTAPPQALPIQQIVVDCAGEAGGTLRFKAFAGNRDIWVYISTPGKPLTSCVMFFSLEDTKQLGEALIEFANQHGAA